MEEEGGSLGMGLVSGGVGGGGRGVGITDTRCFVIGWVKSKINRSCDKRLTKQNMRNTYSMLKDLEG